MPEMPAVTGSEGRESQRGGRQSHAIRVFRHATSVPFVVSREPLPIRFVASGEAHDDDGFIPPEQSVRTSFRGQL